MTYISKDIFENLSDADKEKYYEDLKTAKSGVYTAENMDELAQAFEEIDDYRNAVGHARELRYTAEEQRKEDLRYNLERRKKGFLISAAVVAGFVLLAAVCSIIAII